MSALQEVGVVSTEPGGASERASCTSRASGLHGRLGTVTAAVNSVTPRNPAVPALWGHLRVRDATGEGASGAQAARRIGRQGNLTSCRDPGCGDASRGM